MILSPYDSLLWNRSKYHLRLNILSKWSKSVLKMKHLIIWLKLTGKQKCYFKLLSVSRFIIPHTAYIASIPELQISGTNVLCTQVLKMLLGRAETFIVRFLICNTFASWLLKKQIKYQSKKQGKLQVHSIPLWRKPTAKYNYF